MSLILALKLIDVLAAIVAVGSTVTDASWRPAAGRRTVGTLIADLRGRHAEPRPEIRHA